LEGNEPALIPALGREFSAFQFVVLIVPVRDRQEITISPEGLLGPIV